MGSLDKAPISPGVSLLSSQVGPCALPRHLTGAGSGARAAVKGSSAQQPGACSLSLTREELEPVPSSGLYSGVGHAQEKP